MNPVSSSTDQKDPVVLDDDNPNHIGFFYIGISILAHLLFLFGMLFLQNFHFPRPLPTVIQVDLISFAQEPMFEDASGGQQASVEEKVVDPQADIPPEPSGVKEPVPEQTVPEETVQESPPEEVSVKKPDISLKTKPKNLQELIDSKPEKEEKPLEKKVEKKAEAPKKEKVEDQGPKNDKQIASALSRLEKLVQEQHQKKAGQGGAENEGVGEGSASGSPHGSGSGGTNYTPIDLYNMVLASAITQNWVFNDRLANMDKNLETTVLITILKNGRLREVFFETRSGNAYLDDSAEKAIRKAEPLPELPKGYSTYTVGLIFTPKGLK